MALIFWVLMLIWFVFGFVVHFRTDRCALQPDRWRLCCCSSCSPCWAGRSLVHPIQRFWSCYKPRSAHPKTGEHHADGNDHQGERRAQPLPHPYPRSACRPSRPRPAGQRGRSGLWRRPILASTILPTVRPARAVPTSPTTACRAVRRRTLQPGATLVLVRDPAGVWHYATLPAGTPPVVAPPIAPTPAPEAGLKQLVRTGRQV